MSGNLPPEPLSLAERARRAERDWKRKLSRSDRNLLPSTVDVPAGPGRVRVRQISEAERLEQMRHFTSASIRQTADEVRADAARAQAEREADERWWDRFGRDRTR